MGWVNPLRAPRLILPGKQGEKVYQIRWLRNYTSD